MIRPFPDQAFADAFSRLPQDMALMLRDLILSTAWDMPEVGDVTETLRWGQPAYIAAKGSTLRIGAPKTGGVGLYAHCQTTIISSYAAAFPGKDRIDGNRGVIFENVDEIVPDRLRLLIRHGLTYHLQEAQGGALARRSQNSDK